MNYVLHIVRWAAEITNAYLSHIAIFLIISTITVTVLYLRERYEWKTGQFGRRVNISLNLVIDEILCLRTIHEHAIQDIFLSSYARRLLAKAAKKSATTSDAILSFEDERDAWLVYNDVINAISGMYGGHMLAAAARGIVKEESFLIAITYERDEAVRIKKFRILVAQESMLQELMKNPNPGLEELRHGPRIATLKAMYARFKAGAWPRYQIVSIPCAD